MKSPKIGIVCAYHPEEDDLDATLESAAKSAGKSAKMYAVCDKDESGPGANRHRGIVAADSADVIIIIDAHMRFRGRVLSMMAKAAWQSGDLLTPFCHHNAECSFEGNGGHYYAGARIVFKARDGREFKPLDAKWSRDSEPGARGCVMGACYAFRRDWYMGEAGQPLSILSGWGCDEQVLSISAWMTGHGVGVFNGHVAHRWRARPPWSPSRKAIDQVSASRVAMIQAFVSDATDRAELLSWGNLRDQPVTKEVERLRMVMLAAPRTWRAWKSEVCEPDELDGRQAHRPAPGAGHDRRIHTPNLLVPRIGITCPHCSTSHESPRVTHVYPGGNKRHICPTCGNPFMSFRAPAIHGLN